MHIKVSRRDAVHLSAKEALARLKEGNVRFLAGNTSAPALDNQLLNRQAKAQQPYATILGCSDSRVPPELLFDAWLGELFVIRVAGNVLSSSILGTLQYATRHLKTQLFVVLGHERCGAVETALSYQFEGHREPERIESLLQAIAPALKSLDPNQAWENLVSQAVEANVRTTVQNLLNTPEGQMQIAHGVKLIGAVYDIATGRVRFLE